MYYFIYGLLGFTFVKYLQKKMKYEYRKIWFNTAEGN